MYSAENAQVQIADMPDVGFSVRKFDVVETISHLFDIHLEVRSPNENIDVGGLVGMRAWFVLEGDHPRRWQGVIEAGSFDRTPETDNALSTYSLRIVPSLHRLTHRTRHRLLQHQSIPDMVRGILEIWHIAHRFELGQTYPELELRTQYAESDFDFVSRLLEEAGISYRFEDAVGDEDAVLLFSDEPQRRAVTLAPLTFSDDVSTAIGSAVRYATGLSVSESSRPGSVTMRGFDPKRPRAPLFFPAASDRPQDAAGDHLMYAPQSSLIEGHAVGDTPVADDRGVARHDEAFGVAAARRHLESVHAERKVVRFLTNEIGVGPGVTFVVVGHPRLELAAPLMSVELRHRGEIAKPEEWTHQCRAVPVERPYRPPRLRPKPKIYGVQSAVVVGASHPAAATLPGPGGVGAINGAAMNQNEANERLVDNDIYVDEHARVRVQFPWDRDHGFDGESSTWMRVSQGWAGAGYGAFTIPRVGHEVLVAYVDGDVDAPIVVGRVHNSAQPPPFPLPENKTVSTIRTASSPGGGGFNELRFDDARDREHVYLQAQKDMDALVKHDLKEAVGNDKQSFVQGHVGEGVGGNQTAFVNLGETRVVGLNQVETVGVNRVATVGGDDVTTVGTRWSVQVARGLSGQLGERIEKAATGLGGVLRSVATGVLSSIGQDPLTPMSNAPLTGFGSNAYRALNDVAEFLEGFEIDRGPLPTSVEVQDRQIKLTTGEASIILDGPNVTIVADGNISFHAGGNVATLAEGQVAIAGGDDVAIVSDEKTVIVQAQQDIHLNPFDPGQARVPIAAAREVTDDHEDSEHCDICGGELEPVGRFVRCPFHGEGTTEEDA